MTELKLTVAERILLNVLYPECDDLINQIRVKAIEEKVRFEEDEIEKINLKFNPQTKQYEWERDKAEEKTYSFTPEEIVLLRERVQVIIDKKEVKRSMVDLFIKIKGEK